ncbi:TetR/AcrR family transcriptional regulator [Dermatobacter hominis]|uniref:TetR/AcrR family transcriptional regulator n=1 Tax=Dermatobacter hominis TaxID=2884263 RepID=UPI001D11186C|nr:TetR family transcriptional regulator [Dermatobacter hominis]UDY35667.1 TetR family transcriptional regulator [Dermatobacter hominis]
MAGRERNPERSRERILDAALSEFSEHGYAGARVDAIARRAGLNKQLISHHFGGKLGLYRSVMAERRMRGGGELVGSAEDVPHALAAFFDRAGADPEWIRVLLWETLERPDEDDGTGPDRDRRRQRYGERIDWVRHEQEAGRLPADLDPTLLLMSLLGAALYPVLLPEVCEIATGLRPEDEAFASRYRDHLRSLAGHLAAAPAADG